MDPLVYSAQALGYILGPKPLEDWQKAKVKVIEDINTIQLKLKKGSLTPKQFDDFWDGPLHNLTTIINDQASLLHKS